MLGLRITPFGQGLTDLRGTGINVVIDPDEDIRNQILMTITYTTHSANAFPLLLPPPSF